GDTVADRAGLTGHAAALDLDHRVEMALGAGDAERHLHVRLVHGVAEVLFEAPTVHDDLALARQQPDARDRRLAAAGPGEEGRCGHRDAPQASGSGRWA